LFEDAEPSKVKLLTDRDSGESKCLAFVDFESTDKVDAAIKKNNAELDGKTIFVAFNAPKGDGDKGGKDFGKDSKGKGKKGGKKGKKGKDGDKDNARALTSGSIQSFEGKTQTFNDSDSD